MKTFSIDDIRYWDPCYDPVKYLPEGWAGTAIDMLKNESIPFQDRLWAVLRTELVSERLMRLFAVWSYRQTLAFIKDPDPRSLAAATVAERYANGEATAEELAAAWSAAWSAESAARSAARSAAESAAESAAYSAANSAANSAAWSAESAAWSAESAARSAARSAACSAAYSAAYSAAWSAQQSKLIEMIEMENKE